LDRITRVENIAPWASFGNNGNDFNSGALSVGAHRLTAIAFTADNAAGLSGALQSVNFSVIDQPPTPAPFVLGDFVTLMQVDWGNAPVLATVTPFSTVYPLGLRVGVLGVPGQYSILLSSGTATLNYLPNSGVPAVLTQSYVDPNFRPGGVFGGELTGLHLNIDFADAGLMGGTLGIPFGDLTLTGISGSPGLEGMRVRDFASLANRAIGGEATGYCLDDLTLISAELNAAFRNGVPTAWAQEHLRRPA